MNLQDALELSMYVELADKALSQLREKLDAKEDVSPEQKRMIDNALQSIRTFRVAVRAVDSPTWPKSSSSSTRPPGAERSSSGRGHPSEPG